MDKKEKKPGNAIKIPITWADFDYADPACVLLCLYRLDVPSLRAVALSVATELWRRGEADKAIDELFNPYRRFPDDSAAPGHDVDRVPPRRREP